MNIGKIVQIIGPVIDVEFKQGELPRIFNALRLTYKDEGQEKTLVAEVAQHLGDRGRLGAGQYGYLLPDPRLAACHATPKNAPPL